ncbi:MAG: bifunctional DNA-formamidopyrimidine glycosylase/DNA-(apurinic or apyrimidinic site) lyase [Candidatus Pacearchaeota archaeon]
MPELPEVETIKNYLEKFLLGKKIVGFRNLNKKQVKIKAKEIIGEKISNIERKGKILILTLTNNKKVYIHLKMTGQLIFQHELKPIKFTRAIFQFSRAYLLFNDARKFGWIKFQSEEIKKLGIEPFNQAFNLQNLQKIFRASKRPIKRVLMDQKKIAGIGNIYANEALFLAKINPLKPASALTNEEIRELRNSILEVLKKALKYEGTSLRFYLKPDQTNGRYQEKFLVYQKEGENCYYCHDKIKKIFLDGRSTFYCPSCQKEEPNLLRRTIK